VGLPAGGLFTLMEGVTSGRGGAGARGDVEEATCIVSRSEPIDAVGRLFSTSFAAMMRSACTGLQLMSKPWDGADEVARHGDVARNVFSRWIGPHAVHQIRQFWDFGTSDMDACTQLSGAADIKEAHNTTRRGCS
jgi:hypothetical protein